MNDSLSSFNAELTVKVVDFVGKEYFRKNQDLLVEDNTSNLVFSKMNRAMTKF
ncbi:MAG: hypothetical protein ACOCYO_06045 [Bacteroidota bacterium]